MGVHLHQKAEGGGSSPYQSQMVILSDKAVKIISVKQFEWLFYRTNPNGVVSHTLWRFKSFYYRKKNVAMNTYWFESKASVIDGEVILSVFLSCRCRKVYGMPYYSLNTMVSGAAWRGCLVVAQKRLQIDRWVQIPLGPLVLSDQ